MNSAELTLLADYHEKQAGYYARVGAAIRDGSISKRHEAHATWHEKQASGLRALAKSCAGARPVTASPTSL